jgi:hypothetical protein
LRQATFDGKLPYVWFHVPNEFGKSLPIFGTKLGWMGRVPGASDYIFLGPNPFVIEFKSEKGKQSENQMIFEAWCKAIGIPYYLCRSSDEGRKIVESHIL